MPRPAEPARPGTQGKLHVRTERDGEQIEGEGDYRYIGRLANGILAFVPEPAPAPIFVHANEIVEFRPAP